MLSAAASIQTRVGKSHATIEFGSVHGTKITALSPEAVYVRVVD